MKFYHTKRFKQKQNKKELEKSKGIFYVNIGLFALTALVAISYFIQINAHASKGYILLDVEKDIAQLEKESRDLELKAVDLSSMNALDKRIGISDFVEIESVEYLHVNNEVAKK